MEPQVTISLEEYNKLLSTKKLLDDNFNGGHMVKIQSVVLNGFAQETIICYKEVADVINPIVEKAELHLKNYNLESSQRSIVEKRYNILEKDYEFLKGKYDELKAQIAKKPWYKFW